MVSRNENDNPHSRLCLSHQRVAKGVYLLKVDNNYVGAHLETNVFWKKPSQNINHMKAEHSFTIRWWAWYFGSVYIYKPHEY